MKKPNTIEDEIDAIRDKIYEETKDMTIEERIAFIHARTAPIIKEFNIHVATPEELEALRRRPRRQRLVLM